VQNVAELLVSWREGECFGLSLGLMLTVLVSCLETMQFHDGVHSLFIVGHLQRSCL